MPKKIDLGSKRQLAAALGSESDPKSETAPKSVPKPLKRAEKPEPTPSKPNFQIRTTIAHDSELGKAIMAEAARINDLAGRELLSPNKLASEFVRDFNEELVDLFLGSLAKK